MGFGLPNMLLCEDSHTGHERVEMDCTDLVQFYPPSLLASSVGKPYSQLRETSFTTYRSQPTQQWSSGDSILPTKVQFSSWRRFQAYSKRKGHPAKHQENMLTIVEKYQVNEQIPRIQVLTPPFQE